GNVRQLQSASARNDGRIPNLLKIIERAIQANVNLLGFRIDRSRRSYGILTNQRIEDISCAHSQSSQPFVGELNKNTFWPLSNNVNFLHPGHMKHPRSNSSSF